MPAKYFHIRNINNQKTNCLAFKILENAANCNCLFLSIMQYLEYIEMYEMPRNVADLRQKIVNYVSHPSNWNRFVDTIAFNLENLLPDLKQVQYFDAFKSIVYRQHMSQQCQYGTFAELQAASEIFNFVYVVFRKEKRRSQRNDGTKEAWYNCYRSEDRRLKSEMFLFFSGTPSSGHFQFMKPILPENILIVPQGEYKRFDKYHASDKSYTILSVKKINDIPCSLCGICKEKSEVCLIPEKEIITNESGN